MNWSRGFFRLWIAIACLWIGGATLIAYQEWQSELSREREATPPIQAKSEGNAFAPLIPPQNLDTWSQFLRAPNEDLQIHRAEAARRRRDLIETYIYAGLLPPLALLGVGLVIRWIVRGFS